MLNIRLCILITPLAVLAITHGDLSGNTVDKVAETRRNLLEVVQLRETLSDEKRAWWEQRDLMESQLRLDAEVLKQLETQLAEGQPQLEALLAESNRLKLGLEESDQLLDFWRRNLEVLKHRLMVTVSRLPPGLATDLGPFLNDLRTIDPHEDPAHLKRVLDLALEVLSKANAYHRKIHHVTEVRDLADGRLGEFNVIYLGISAGYYYSENLHKAGVVRWNNDQWEWIEDSSLLESLVLLGSVISGREPPGFMSVRLQLAGEVTP